MTFAELHAAFDGFARANSAADSSDGISDEEYLRVLMEEQVAGRA